ncbi:MAG: S26 family signal peptidase [Phycisphaerales bacterium]|nr:S26 family signal peptidase [Phycisphaerales bacterium]
MKTEIKSRSSTPDSQDDKSVEAIVTSEPTSTDGIRDTIESVIVAFILAFVFRAFIVEAFVIPTGSMAPSLYGQHGQHRCDNCRYPISYGIREPIGTVAGTLRERDGRLRTFDVCCPNCSWQSGGNANINRDRDNRVVPNSGDRILVLKWPYDIGGDWLGPKRWDVVVFKDPKDGEQNFIKRLLGLPGEVLELINGDLYTAPIESVPEDIQEALSRPPPTNPNEPRLTQEQERKLAGLLKIQRKTSVAQSSLWMLHYDHDYVPRERRGRSHKAFNPPYWEGRTGPDKKAWDASTPVVRFKPEEDDRLRWLSLKGRPIQDDYGYNNVSSIQGNRQTECYVGDVRLKFTLFPGHGEGEVILALSKGTDEFRVRLASDGKVALEKLDRSAKNGVWVELKNRKVTPWQQGDALDLEFENLDYRLALRINHEEIIWTDDIHYAPDILKLLKQPYEDGRNSNAGIKIGAKGAPIEIRHLQIHRDVFYRSVRLGTGGSIDFNRCPGWGTATNPILLRNDPPDYYCCGDNSPQSQDSRLWVEVCPMLQARQRPNHYQFGTVPGDQLIGKAFFVYWPSGLRFSKETPAVIPNVGRMRMIR